MTPVALRRIELAEVAVRGLGSGCAGCGRTGGARWRLELPSGDLERAAALRVELDVRPIDHEMVHRVCGYAVDYRMPLVLRAEVGTDVGVGVKDHRDGIIGVERPVQLEQVGGPNAYPDSTVRSDTAHPSARRLSSAFLRSRTPVRRMNPHASAGYARSLAA